MACACNKCAKILSIIGIIFFVVGGIVYIIAHVTVSDAVTIESVSCGTSCVLANDDRMAGTGNRWHVFIAGRVEDDVCEANVDSATLDTPGTEGTDYACYVGDTMTIDCGFVGSCTSIPAGPEDWSMTHDPPLQSFGYARLPDDPNGAIVTETHDDGAGGTYTTERRPAWTGSMTLNCPVPCWYIDVHDEIGEAVTGIFAALGLMVVMIIMFIAATILFCVACCCCCQGPDQPKPTGQPIQGQVVGTPVATT